MNPGTRATPLRRSSRTLRRGAVLFILSAAGLCTAVASLRAQGADRSQPRAGPDPTLPRAALGRALLRAVGISEGLSLPLGPPCSAIPNTTYGPGLSALGGGAVVALGSHRASSAYFPAGRFVLGSSVEEALEAMVQCTSQPLAARCRHADFAAEVPRHEVVLSAFWLDRTEVTRSHYRRCVEAGACSSAPLVSWGARSQQAQLPATQVRFEEARAYCRFRRARLPTEAEFERAARGARRRRYPWGDLFNPFRLNASVLPRARVTLAAPRGFPGLLPVGCFADGATPEGVLDLAGNVAEWVLDRFEPGYPGQLQVDPQGPAASRSLRRAVRGGSYKQGSVWQRGAARRGVRGDRRLPDLGFRCLQPAAAGSPG